MYSEELLPIIDICNIRQCLSNIRLNCTNAMIHYDNNYVYAINKNKEVINKSYSHYVATASDESESKLLTQFQKQYESYIKLMDEALNLASMNKRLPKDKEIEFVNIGTKIEKDLDSLQKYDLEWAKKDKLESDTIFKVNRNVLITILVLSIIIFAMVSTFIINGLKKYIKEVDDILKEIEKGNLDIDIEIKGSNELEYMKKSIKNTVKSFSNTVKDLKDKIILINDSSNTDR